MYFILVQELALICLFIQDKTFRAINKVDTFYFFKLKHDFRLILTYHDFQGLAGDAGILCIVCVFLYADILQHSDSWTNIEIICFNSNKIPHWLATSPISFLQQLLKPLALSSAADKPRPHAVMDFSKQIPVTAWYMIVGFSLS